MEAVEPDKRIDIEKPGSSFCDEGKRSVTKKPVNLGKFLPWPVS
jgi:hypothetical protein